MDSIEYDAWLDEQAAPAVLDRATPLMEEPVWISGGGWIDAEFLFDGLMGHGGTDPFDLELAHRLFPPEAFIEPGGSHGKDGPEPGGSAPDHPPSGCHEPADPEGEPCPPL